MEGFARPITGKKESRQEHPENNMYSTTYLEQLDETVWICNQDFSEVYYVNPAYERMWGQDPRRLLEHPASLLESVHPLDVNWLSSALRTGLGHEFEQEYRIIRPDGMTLWIRSRAIPVEGAWTEPRILVLSMDLTNHKFITQCLEEQLQILNQIHDSVVSTDLDGYVTSWNRSAEASLGYTAAEAIGMHISFIYPGDQIEFLETEVITPLNEKGSHEVEVQLLDKDNRRFHAHLSLSRFYDEDGQPRGVVGYFLDISEKIASATKLKEHIRLHQAVADLGMSALDGSGLTALFAEATKMVATTLQVEFTKVLELQPDGHSLLLRAGVGWKKGAVGKATVETKEQSQASFTLQRRDPVVVEDFRREQRFEKPALLAEHDVQSGINVVIYGRNKPFGVLGAHSRATRSYSRSERDFMQAIANILASAVERKSAERALHNSEQRFRSIFENAAAGMVTTDHHGRFLRVNPAFCRFLGYSKEELLLKSAKEVTFEADRDITNREYEKILQNERHVMDLIKRYRRKNGRIVWGHTTVAWVFDSNSHPEYSIGLIQNITELKQAENHLRKLSGHLMSVREEEQKRIARKIHDELGQAMVGMQMNLSWLLNTLPEKNAVWLEKLQSLRAVTEEAMDSVEKIASELRPRILDVLGLREAIQWYIEEFGATFGIRYSVRFTPEDPELGTETAIVLYRVFQEALTNVHRHARATEVQIRLYRRQDDLHFLVKDNGVGITPEQIQAPDAFGLLGIQERVLSIGGTLDIWGEPDNGTTVRVTAPFTSKEFSR